MRKTRLGTQLRSVSRCSMLVGITLLTVLFATGCHTRKHTGSLTTFVQSDRRTLIEVVDGEGHSWKIVSAIVKNRTVYFVVNANNHTDLVASVSTNQTGQHSVVFVDSTDKARVLGVFDKRFLSNVRHTTEAYRKWVDQQGDLTYGSVPDTRMIGMNPGALGTATVGVKGDTIVAQIANVQCHCYEIGYACVGLPSPLIACVNSTCDWINCVVGLLNGKPDANDPDCSQHYSDQQTTCSLALGYPQ